MSIQTLSQALKKSQQKGFTLVELLTVVAVVGISLGVGLPNLQSFMQDNHQTNAINEFSSYVTYARNEAVVRNTTVTLCVANADKSACDSNQSNWANGYVVMAKGVTKPLKVHDTLPGNQTITGNSNSLVFTGNGMLNTAGTLSFCDQRNAEKRQVIINMGSQVRRASTSESCSNSSTS